MVTGLITVLNGNGSVSGIDYCFSRLLDGMISKRDDYLSPSVSLRWSPQNDGAGGRGDGYMDGCFCRMRGVWTRALLAKTAKESLSVRAEGGGWVG